MQRAHPQLLSNKNTPLRDTRRYTAFAPALISTGNVCEISPDVRQLLFHINLRGLASGAIGANTCDLTSTLFFCASDSTFNEMLHCAISPAESRSQNLVVGMFQPHNPKEVRRAA
jgi:hypothetical protein